MLEIIGAIFWVITYILIIKKGFHDKTYGIPMVSLCANNSWEFIFSFIFPHSGIQLWVNISWFLLDVILLYQFLKYGKSDFSRFLNEKWFYPVFFITLTTCFFTILFITYEFQNWNGMYTSFTLSCMMSILFVFMLIIRNNSRGQSIYIALFKMLGTLAYDVMFFDFYPTLFLFNFLYVTIFIFDLMYFVMLYKTNIDEKINPWTGKPFNHKTVSL